jgi:histidinol-phosphate/aromatic aminotransferase/cobyric acid decarboxylase-like protein/choline kinase
MQAIILAAGIGKRLRPLTDDIPKCMVPVNGTPILINTLDILSQFPVQEVIIVVGHKKEVIMDRVGTRYKGMTVTYVVNEVYDKTNNIYSLWLAKDLIRDNVLLFEGDIFFEKALVELALKDENRNSVLVNSYKSYMDGTVLEINPDQSVKRMIPRKEQGADFDFSDKYKTVNIYNFTRDFFRNVLVPHLDTYLKTQSVNEYYELVLGVIIYIGNPKLYAAIADDIKWYEIDDANDLQKAGYIFSGPEERLRTIDTSHGGYWRYEFTDFCYLYNLYFPTPRLMNELTYALPRLMSNYPSGLAFMKRLLSQWIGGVPPEHLVVGNGASEIIKIMNRLFVKKMTIPVPSFNEYENTLGPGQVHAYNLAETGFALEPKRLVEEVRKSGSNAVLIINPNNPTSIYLPRKDVLGLLDAFRDLDLVVLDESFIDFVDAEPSPSLADVYARYPNLVILKSISKVYGVPGLRLGYILTAGKDLAEGVSRELPIWNINSMAEYFLEIFIKYQSDFESSCRKVMADRKEFLEGLKAVPYLDLYPAQANYVFARITDERSSADLKRQLFSGRDLLIKDCGNKSGLPDKKYVRISVRRKDDNDRLLRALLELA